MPYKDPAKERERSRLKYYRRKAIVKPATECSVQDCHRPHEEGKVKCSKHLAYMRGYKATNRIPTESKKAKGLCIGSDCTKLSEPGFSRCATCRARAKDWEDRNLSKVREKHGEMRHKVKTEVFMAYGGRCLCCGEHREDLLTLDHIGGYRDGPRGGDALRAWAKRNGYPVTLRLLCMNCNFALGHRNRCPHGLEDYGVRVGRPPETVYSSVGEEHKVRERRRNGYVKLKLQILNAYGGQKCACCGTEHLDFLSIDHIDNNGAAHRLEITGSKTDGRNFYIWLRKNHFPPGYQVLCHSCNLARNRFGQCPHERERLAAAPGPTVEVEPGANLG